LPEASRNLVGTWDWPGGWYTFEADGTGSIGRGAEERHPIEWNVTVEGNGLRVYYQGTFLERLRERWGWEEADDRLLLTSRQLENTERGLERIAGPTDAALADTVVGHPLVGAWTAVIAIEVDGSWAWEQTEWIFDDDGTGRRGGPGQHTQDFTWAVATRHQVAHITPVDVQPGAITAERWDFEVSGDDEATLISRQSRSSVRYGPIRFTLDLTRIG
jgi:hypothetical protein